MAEIPILLPKLEEQRCIADILSSFDDKIELNRRINDNLEQQVQALFKAWFVDFERSRMVNLSILYWGVLLKSYQ